MAPGAQSFQSCRQPRPFLGYITLVVFAVIRVVTALFLKAGFGFLGFAVGFSLQRAGLAVKGFGKSVILGRVGRIMESS